MASIEQDLSNRSESVERIYGFYTGNRFLVNRRYQRKLVWSVEEKRAFLDSIRRGFPVPLILLAEVDYDREARFEIIDGMQRLNAVTSFIEGEFDLDGAYFDLATMAETKLLVDTGKVEQRHPILAREICIKIVRYSVPLTVYPSGDHAEVDEIFRRINAYGRHLSRQELRVAGVTTQFSQLVRDLASRIRGDVSAQEKLYLGAMKEISITSKELSYGLNVDKVFWVEQGVQTRDYIRQSRDEELIADMLGYILLTPKLSSSAEIIDELFGYAPDGNKQTRRDEIEVAVKKQGSDLIRTQFLAVYEALRRIIQASGKRFSELMFKDAGQRVPRYFQSVFLGIWELLINEGLTFVDFGKAAAALDGAGNNIDVGGGGGRFSAQDREKNVNVVKGLLRPVCVKRGANDPVISSWVTELENLLMQSHTEQSLYDFKQGFKRVEVAAGFDDSAFEKVFKTLTAMANHAPGAVGYVIVGIADDKATAERVEALYGTIATPYKRFLITGVDHEASELPKGLDSYFHAILQRLASSPMSQWAKDQVARDSRLMSYFDKSLVVFKVVSGKEPCAFGAKYYERRGPNVIEIPQGEYATLFRRFLAS
jgi:hypothetical protein